MTEEVNPWKEAIIHCCIVSWVDWDENDPMKTLANLISREIDYALDPLISSDAQKLIDRGRAEAEKEFEARMQDMGKEQDLNES